GGAGGAALGERIRELDAGGRLRRGRTPAWAAGGRRGSGGGGQLLPPGLRRRPPDSGARHSEPGVRRTAREHAVRRAAGVADNERELRPRTVWPVTVRCASESETMAGKRLSDIPEIHRRRLLGLGAAVAAPAMLGLGMPRAGAVVPDRGAPPMSLLSSSSGLEDTSITDLLKQLATGKL